MSLIPNELKYVDSHEWLRLEDDGTITIGITEHARELLGDIVFVELPKVGTSFVEDDVAAVVESVKAASDVYAPIACEIVAINDALVDTPEILNDAPYGEGWFFRVKVADKNILSTLLSAEEYAKLIGE